jgi:hypothetical protein
VALEDLTVPVKKAIKVVKKRTPFVPELQQKRRIFPKMLRRLPYTKNTAAGVHRPRNFRGLNPAFLPRDKFSIYQEGDRIVVILAARRARIWPFNTLKAAAERRVTRRVHAHKVNEYVVGRARRLAKKTEFFRAPAAVALAYSPAALLASPAPQVNPSGLTAADVLASSELPAVTKFFSMIKSFNTCLTARLPHPDTVAQLRLMRSAVPRTVSALKSRSLLRPKKAYRLRDRSQKQRSFLPRPLVLPLPYSSRANFREELADPASLPRNLASSAVADRRAVLSAVFTHSPAALPGTVFLPVLAPISVISTAEYAARKLEAAQVLHSLNLDPETGRLPVRLLRDQTNQLLFKEAPGLALRDQVKETSERRAAVLAALNLRPATHLTVAQSAALSTDALEDLFVGRTQAKRTSSRRVIVLRNASMFAANFPDRTARTAEGIRIRRAQTFRAKIMLTTEKKKYYYKPVPTRVRPPLLTLAQEEAEAQLAARAAFKRELGAVVSRQPLFAVSGAFPRKTRATKVETKKSKKQGLAAVTAAVSLVKPAQKSAGGTSPKISAKVPAKAGQTTKGFSTPSLGRRGFSTSARKAPAKFPAKAGQVVKKASPQAVVRRISYQVPSLRSLATRYTTLAAITRGTLLGPNYQTARRIALNALKAVRLDRSGALEDLRLTSQGLLISAPISALLHTYARNRDLETLSLRYPDSAPRPLSARLAAFIALLNTAAVESARGQLGVESLSNFQEELFCGTKGLGRFAWLQKESRARSVLSKTAGKKGSYHLRAQISPALDKIRQKSRALGLLNLQLRKRATCLAIRIRQASLRPQVFTRQRRLHRAAALRAYYSKLLPLVPVRPTFQYKTLPAMSDEARRFRHRLSVRIQHPLFVSRHKGAKAGRRSSRYLRRQRPLLYHKARLALAASNLKSYSNAGLKTAGGKSTLLDKVRALLPRTNKKAQRRRGLTLSPSLSRVLARAPYRKLLAVRHFFRSFSNRRRSETKKVRKLQQAFELRESKIAARPSILSMFYKSKAADLRRRLAPALAPTTEQRDMVADMLRLRLFDKPKPARKFDLLFLRKQAAETIEDAYRDSIRRAEELAKMAREAAKRAAKKAASDLILRQIRLEREALDLAARTAAAAKLKEEQMAEILAAATDIKKNNKERTDENREVLKQASNIEFERDFRYPFKKHVECPTGLNPELFTASQAIKAKKGARTQEEKHILSQVSRFEFPEAAKKRAKTRAKTRVSHGAAKVRQYERKLRRRISLLKILEWPVEAPQKRLFRHATKKIAFFYRMRSQRTIAPTFPRNAHSGAFIRSQVRQLRHRREMVARAEVKAVQPYHSPIYRLLPRRWHSPRSVDGYQMPVPRMSRFEKSRQSVINDTRHLEKQAAVRRYRQAKTTADRQKYLRLSEAPHLQRVKFVDQSWRELELKAGYPASLGYRRIRQVYRNSFVTNRWWRPTPRSLPSLHPFSQVPEHEQPASFRRSAFKHQYYTDKDTWTKQKWRALRNGEIQEGTSLKSSAHWLHSQTKVREIVKGLSSGRWVRYAKLVGSNTEAALFCSFLLNRAPLWLEDRPVEKALQAWTAADWTVYGAETGMNITAAKAEQLELSRRQLFIRSPNWWAEEAARRMQILDALLAEISPLKTAHTNATTYSLYQARLRVHKELDTRDLLAHDKRLRAFTTKHFFREKAVVVTAANPSDNISNLMSAKEYAIVYQTWLAGSRLVRKEPKMLQSSFEYRETHRAVIRDLPFEYPRFPGKGDTELSYDSVLRNFYRKTIYARFRRNNIVNFKTLRPENTDSAMASLVKHELGPVLALKRRMSSQMTKVAYLSRGWRKLLQVRRGRSRSRLNVRTNTSQDGQMFVGTKRRLAFAPFNLTARGNALMSSIMRPTHVVSDVGTLSGVLETALNARLAQRKFLDFKERLYRREQSVERILPHWTVTQMAHFRRSQNGPVDEYETDYYDPYLANHWVAKDFRARMPKISLRPFSYRPLTQSGELLSVPQVIAREKWAADFSALKRRASRDRVTRLFQKPLKKRAPTHEELKARIPQFKKKRKYHKITKARIDLQKFREKLVFVAAHKQALKSKKPAARLSKATIAANRKEDYNRLPRVRRFKRRLARLRFLTRHVHDRVCASLNRFKVLYPESAQQRKREEKVARLSVLSPDIKLRARQRVLRSRGSFYYPLFNLLVKNAKAVHIRRRNEVTLRSPRRKRIMSRARCEKKEALAKFQQDRKQAFAERILKEKGIVADPKRKKSKVVKVRRRSKRGLRLRRLWNRRPNFERGGRLRQKQYAQQYQAYLAAPHRTLHRLVSEVSRLPVLTPMIFDRPTTKKIETAADLLQRKEGLASSVYDRYRRTATIADATHAYFPALMSWLMKRGLQGKVIPLEQAQGLVVSTYWNLRLYLNQDEAGTRLASRDVTPLRRRALNGEFTNDSLERYFDLTKQEEMRQSMQPYEIPNKKAMYPAALRWLSKQFPRFYAYHLEDPDAFVELTVTALQAFRIQPSNKSPREWKTQTLGTPSELTFRRLISVKPVAETTRYETMLMFGKREAVLPGVGAATNLPERSLRDLKKPLVTRGSFFARPFSSNMRIIARDILVLGRMSIISRLVAEDEENEEDERGRGLSPLSAAIAHREMKSRNSAKSRLGVVYDRGETGLGALDPRYIRGKSPRTRQYIQRLTFHCGTADLVYFMAILRAHTEKKHRAALQQAEAVTRDCRASLALGFDTVTETEFPALALFRSEIAARRLPTSLTARALVVRAAVIDYSYRRLYITQPMVESRALTAFNSETVPYYSLSLVEQTVRRRADLESAKQRVTTDRSILQYRRADQRSVPLYYSYAPKLPTQTTLLLPAHAVASNSKRAKDLGITLGCKEIAIIPYTKALPTQASKKKLILHLMKGVKLSRAPSPLALNRVHHGVGLKVSETLKTRKVQADSRPFHRWFGLKDRSFRYYCYDQGANYLKNRVTAATNKRNVRRGELYALLTTQRYKKGRVLKTWIKDMKRILIRTSWFRMPEQIFKEMRTRLRELDWKESDQHFERKGLKYAFRLRPAERQKMQGLQAMMMRRSLYSTRHKEYRRYSFPREQKRLSWLQRVRTSLVQLDPTRQYLRNRRYPRLRTALHRLSRSLFDFRNTRTAQRHFKKLSKGTPKTTGFSRMLVGLGNRLDVNLLILGIFPTIFWARRLAVMGFVIVNRALVSKANHRLQPGDLLFFQWERIRYMQAEFTPDIIYYNEHKTINTTFQMANPPGNYSYNAGLQLAVYDRLPRPEDISKNSRLCQWLFDAFRLEAGTGIS